MIHREVIRVEKTRKNDRYIKG